MKLPYFLLQSALCLFILSCSSSLRYNARTPAESESCSLDYEDINIEMISEAIRTRICDIKSVDDVLKIFPDKVFKYPTLVYRSRSLQGPNTTDYMNPRAIVSAHSNDGVVLMSYNGKPDQPGYHNLEIAVANYKTTSASQVIRYFDIEFPSETAGKTWESIQKSINISGANPQKCAKCHGSPARPIFPSYPLWPGMYLSHQGASEFEKNKGKEFFAAAAANPESRYHRLTDDFNRSGFGAEGMNDALGHINGIRLAHIIRSLPEFEKYKYAYYGALTDCENFSSFLPETILTQLLGKLNAQFRLQSRWTKPKYMEMFKKAINDPNIAAYGLPAGMLNHTLKLEYSAFNMAGPTPKADENVLAQAIGRQSGLQEDLLRLAADTLDKQHDWARMYLGLPLHLRLITEGRGIAMNNWALDLTQPTYRFHAAIGAAANIGGRSLLHKLMELDTSGEPYIAEIKNHMTRAWNESAVPSNVNICSQLKAKSQAAFSSQTGVTYGSLQYDPVIKRNQYPATFTETCARCHAYAANDPTPIEMRYPPEVPFSNQDLFNDWLKVPRNKREILARVFHKDEDSRMPPTRLLSDDEKIAIRAYVDSH